MIRRRLVMVWISTIFVATACGGGSASPTGGAGASTGASPSTGASQPAASAGDPNDMLARILKNGEIRVGTDPNYAPQSFLKPDGTFEGFDIDVANEIAKRLGVTAKFETPDFSVVEAGNWADRFDVSVGSVTITVPRLENLDFTQPYYFTPAQMAATVESGVRTLEGLAGDIICVGEGTTYYQWLTGTLKLGDKSALAQVPQGATATTLKTDQDCAQSIQSGRHDFQGWLSSSTTVDAAIKGGAPFATVGDPVFFEPLAVAIDKKSPPHAELLAAIEKIVADMHADGTLSAFSKKWFEGLDLTTK